MKRLLLAGGGTGGHLFPAIAVARAFRAEQPAGEVLFVGTERGIEARLLPEQGWPLQLVNASGFVGKGLIGKVAALGRMTMAVREGLAILGRFKPDVVLGVGGYASAAMVLAARLKGIPTVLHEQNAIPGLTNRLLGRFAGMVCVTFAATRQAFGHDRVEVTGNPVRPEMTECGELPAGDPQLLVFGGSRGARAINDAVCAALPLLKAEVQIVHQTGSEDRVQVDAAYKAQGRASARIEAFIDDMAGAYRQAQLVVCRAGATTLAELAAAGRPAVLIPYPHAAGDHQTANARAMAEAGAAVLLPQQELNAERLASLVNELLADRSRLTAMAAAARAQAKTDAARAIVAICRRLGGGKKVA